MEKSGELKRKLTQSIDDALNLSKKGEENHSNLN
jgi:hypothetical protein